MGQPTGITPQPHHGYESWTAFWYGPDRKADGELRRHCKRFGRTDEVSKREAWAAYQHWLNAEFPTLAVQRSSYTVPKLCVDWFEHERKHYVRNGRQTASVSRIRTALESLGTMFENTPADGLSHADLANWLESMITKRTGDGTERARCVETVNTYLGYVKRMYRWARRFKGISAATMADLVEVEPIRADRADVRRKDDIKPVAWEVVEATMRELPANVADMVLLQWHTGMRPGEVCSVRPCEVDVSGEVWVYAPTDHKLAYRGKLRKVAIGPKARAVLEPYLRRPVMDRCFLPSEIPVEKFGRWRRASTFTPVHYRSLVARGARRAGVEYWHPNQIRHSWATRIEREFGAEAVADGLGHSSVRTQEFYVEKSLKRAMEVAMKVG